MSARRDGPSRAVPARAASAGGGGKPRILFFDAYPHVVAGGQRTTLLIARGLADRGWPVAVATPGPGPFPDAVRASGLPATELRFPRALMVYGRQTTGPAALAAVARLPAAWVPLVRWLRREADIVHVVDHRGLVLLGPAASAARLPVVWHIHGINGNRLLNVVGSGLARRIIVPDGAMADRMPGLRRRAVIAVPNALGSGAFEVTRTPAVHPLVLSVGRLHPDKGVDVLLRAVAELTSPYPDLRAVVAGPTQAGFEDHHAEMLALRRRLGLDGIVDFVGEVADTRALLGTATLYVQASRERTELQPLAILEAMAARVPVVSTRVGAIAGMLDGGRRGLLVPPEDPLALARAIGSVLIDPAAARERAERGHAHTCAACNHERLIDQVEALYRSLRRRSPA